MRKLLSILTVTALAFAMLAGCTSNPKQTTSPTENPDESITPTPTPGVHISEEFIPDFKDQIAFNIFNTTDYQARWGEATKDYLKEKYNLVVNQEIPGCTGFEDTAIVVSGGYMDIENKRLEYNTLLSRLYQSEATTPDFYTSFYASNIALDAPWLIYKNMFVDLNPYLEEGGTLHDGYINYVWKDNADYWNSFKSYLETEDGELFVLPRREMMPIRTFLAWNKDSLKAINVDWEDKATDWNTMLEQLKAYYNKSKSVALQAYCGNVSGYLRFIASTYGLDFNDNFAWTTKNGEPLWTYCWPEYLNILTDLKELAEDHLVYNDKTNGNLVLGYDLDSTSSTVRRVAGDANKWGKVAGQSGLIFMDREDVVTQIYSAGVVYSGLDTWHVSDTWITHEGYEYSMFGSSEFDIDYIAIGNSIDKKRKDHEFTNRICQYLAEYMTEEGFLNYQWGKQGVPFADTVDEAGSWEWIEIDGEKKVLFTNFENRFSWTKEGASPDWDLWFWEDKSENWYAENLDPHYTQYIEYLKNNRKSYEKNLPDVGQSSAAIVGITDTECWDNYDNWRKGVYFFGDITAYPMERTAYWRMESMSKSRPVITPLIEEAKRSNRVVYTGFFKSTSEVMKGGAPELNEKITQLKTIAKNFTTEYLADKRAASTWNSYIKSLKDAGYEDVYYYYSAALEKCQTEHIDSIKSQSDINKQVFNITD